MFTVAICDDDKIVLSSIQKCIEEFATENNISISVDLYDSGKKLLETSLKYNVIFLDIILQTENGIDIGTQLRKLNAFTYIIYITNYKQYHETAHNNVHSFAFLTKPISKKIIYKQLNDILIYESQNNDPLYIARFITYEQGLTEFNIDDIYFFEYIKKRYVKISNQLFRKNVNTIKGDHFMNTYIIYFVSVINCYVSAQLIFDHFKINFNSIYSQKWIYNIVTISVGVLIGIINLFNYPILNFASWIIILTPVICLLFYDPWSSKKTLLLDLYFFIFLLTFFETIGVALYELFLIFIKFPLCEPAHSVFKMAISKLLIICLYQVTKNRYLSKQHSVLPMKQLILYILLSFCSIVNICLNAKIGYSVTMPESDKYIGYLTIIITVFINLHIMWLLEYIIENQKLKSKIARSEQQANLQLKYYKQLDANYQKSLQMIHDIDKHVNTIEQLYKSNEFEKADNYIKGMDRLISDFVLFPYSNNTVLNLILNEKKIFAEQHGILYKCTVEQTDFRFMDDIDITTIFSNLLENALSASALCKTNKEVSVIVSSHNNFVIINVKNSCNSYTKCGTFSSKDYGTGLYNVENSVKKYEGFLKISYSQTEFNCNVVLSNTH